MEPPEDQCVQSKGRTVFIQTTPFGFWLFEADFQSSVGMGWGTSELSAVETFNFPPSCAALLRSLGFG